MPINLISKIKPRNNGQFPVVEDVDIEGGYQVRDDLTDRNSIPNANRKEGMIVHVLSDGYFYTLSGGITNSNWVTQPMGNTGATGATGPSGGGGGSNLPFYNNKTWTIPPGAQFRVTNNINAYRSGSYSDIAALSYTAAVAGPGIGTVQTGNFPFVLFNAMVNAVIGTGLASTNFGSSGWDLLVSMGNRQSTSGTAAYLVTIGKSVGSNFKVCEVIGGAISSTFTLNGGFMIRPWFDGYTLWSYSHDASSDGYLYSTTATSTASVIGPTLVTSNLPANCIDMTVTWSSNMQDGYNGTVWLTDPNNNRLIRILNGTVSYLNLTGSNGFNSNNIAPNYLWFDGQFLWFTGTYGDLEVDAQNVIGYVNTLTSNDAVVYPYGPIGDGLSGTFQGLAYDGTFLYTASTGNGQVYQFNITRAPASTVNAVNLPTYKFILASGDFPNRIIHIPVFASNTTATVAQGSHLFIAGFSNIYRLPPNFMNF